jgi:hypothetical protein
MNTQSDSNDGPGAEVPAEVMAMAAVKVGGLMCPGCQTANSVMNGVCIGCGQVVAMVPAPAAQGGMLPEVGVPAAPMMGPGYVKPAQTGRAQRSQLPDDPEARARVAASEERRERAYHARYEWQGREVVWSLRREGVWMRMRSALGYPDLTVLYTREEAMAVLSDAMMVLFLGLHEPKAIEMLTGSAQRFQQAVEEWADEGAGILMSERKAACVLFHKIVGDGLECIPRPAPMGPGERAPGN